MHHPHHRLGPIAAVTGLHRDVAPLPRTPLLAAVLLASLAARAQAQCPTSHGPFIGTPLGVSLAADPLVPFAAGAVYFKRQGFSQAAPGVWSDDGQRPDFDIARALTSRVSCPATRMPDIDAMSIGLDWILADDATGRVPVLIDRWGALTFSVTRGTTGASRSTIAGEATRADGAAADVFSYVLPGSALPPELVDRTDRAHDSREIDLGDPAAARRDVDGLDHMMSMYDSPELLSLLPPDPTFYFSVSFATIPDVPAAWWLDLNGSATPRSAASILCTTWSRRLRAWSCPRVFKTFRDLGLDQLEDVDALAIDIPNQRILFSTRTRTRNPLLFVFCGARANPGGDTPYSGPDGVPISQKIGLIEGDDIDAVCAMDPSIRSQGGGFSPFFFYQGTPRPKIFPPSPQRLSASSFRGTAAGVPALRSHLIGYPPSGQQDGVAGLFWGLPNVPWPLAGIALVQRDPNSPFCGDPVSASLAIPPALSLVDARIDLRWYVLDAAQATFGEAHPLLVHL